MPTCERTKAVIPQLDSIVQKAESIVLICSARVRREYGESSGCVAFPAGFSQYRFITNSSGCAQEVDFHLFGTNDSKQSEGNTVKLKSVQEDY